MKQSILIGTTVLLLCLCVIPADTFAQRNKESALRGIPWPAASDGIAHIPVCWEDPEGFSGETEIVRQAVSDSWETAADVRFEGWRTCLKDSQGVRIAIKDNQSNVKVPGFELNGKRDGMELNFTFENFASHCRNTLDYCIKAIGIHEFGHVLGLAHEQDHPLSLCKNDQRSKKAVAMTPYDDKSVMNYCNKDWALGLSDLDRQGIRKIYNKEHPYSSKVGQVTFLNILSEDQEWEETGITFNGQERSFTVNKATQKNVMKISFQGTGWYCFQLRTRSSHKDGRTYEGRGEKCVDLEGGKNYSFSVARYEKVNSQGFFDLTLR